MNWTTPSDIKAHVQKLWDRGVLLSDMASGELFAPLRVPLKSPSSSELSDRFTEVRKWIAKLSDSANFYRLEWRTVNHRILGTNDIPVGIRIDSPDDAFDLIDKQKEAEQFSIILKLTQERMPELISWLAKRPLKALELAGDWPQLLAIVEWMQHHPRPAIYLRQIDLPGVHSKLIEGYRGVLSELLDLVLPSEAIDHRHTGFQGFCRRYGFLDKPLRVRFRLLDSQNRLLPTMADQDITVTGEAFSELDLPVSKVFMTENEINFLAFPVVPNAMVIFGAGYGFESLADANWLQQKEIYYWGDLDTHGFAILNQLRGLFSHVTSFLMDQQTLLLHRTLWGMEAQPEKKNLMRLTSEECTLYDQLRHNQWGDRIRMEQERIGFDFLLAALQRLEENAYGSAFDARIV